ncbi:hypothetical protein DM860_010467 [Cuscuta australis]|uniref:t-SNARE coiled-coil homology domain-containing protein n=1 Tax=Cuscuta australis TaxID=267555 RepID=A0A328E576_9ASTE|nr:hypothetical protein DM860_010467 [Cuscuta australis]
MNDLLSRSFSAPRGSPPPGSHAVEMTGGDASLPKFFEDVEAIKADLKNVEEIHARLRTAHEKSKTLHDPKQVRSLRSEMDRDASLALKQAKLIKHRLEELDRSNAANRQIHGFGPGSSADRTRTSVVNGLRIKLKEFVNQFRDLREKIDAEYRDTVHRRYFTVTGENPDEKVLDTLISTGQSETFMQKAIQEQGRGEVMNTVMEIQERHRAVKEVEGSLRELQQVFMDMAVLVEAQGEQLDDIESQVNRANSVVRQGAQHLQEAKKKQRNTRKWTCYAIILLLLIILIIVLSIRPWK